MKGQEIFIGAIQKYITEESKRDPQWGEKVTASGNDAEKCAKYIIEEVKKSGRNGFCDAEIFGMVKHYYDEGLKGPDGWSGCKSAVSNMHVDIGDEEKEKIRKKVEEEYRKELEESERMKERERQQKETEMKERRKERERQQKAAQLDLFGF